MSEELEPDEAVRDALSVVTEVFAAQAVALDRMFYRAHKEAVSANVGSHRHLRKALRAQAKCRATINILLALRAAAGDAKKISNFNERTIANGKSPA